MMIMITYVSHRAYFSSNKVPLQSAKMEIRRIIGQD